MRAYSSKTGRRSGERYIELKAGSEGRERERDTHIESVHVVVSTTLQRGQRLFCVLRFADKSVVAALISLISTDV